MPISKRDAWDHCKFHQPSSYTLKCLAWTRLPEGARTLTYSATATDMFGVLNGKVQKQTRVAVFDKKGLCRFDCIVDTTYVRVPRR